VGIKVTAVEVKDVALPDSMKRAMAKQAEAERGTPREDCERRRRIPSRRENGAGRFLDQQGADCAAIALSPDHARKWPANTTRPRFLPLPIDLFSAF